jgi:hypothetical protein
MKNRRQTIRKIVGFLDNSEENSWGSTLRSAALAMWLALVAGCDRAPPPPTVPPPGAAAPPATTVGRPSAAATLARMQARYANARTYRDAGTCTSQSSSPGLGTGLRVKFATALDRDKGMRWRAEHSDGVGDPGTFTATSRDCVSFDWSWPFAMDDGTGETAWEAFSQSLGNTGHIAGLVPALLLPAVELSAIRLNPATLAGVADAGDETVDGAPCMVVDAAGWHGQHIRLWIDTSGALRQFWASRKTPASLDIPAYTNTITVRYAPEFDVEIRADELAPDPSSLPAPVAGKAKQVEP